MKKIQLLVAFVLATFAAQAQVPAGTPDAYGYVWYDNTDLVNGPTYNWIDITTVGTQVMGLSDDNVIPTSAVTGIQLGFNFQYYWQQKKQIWIGSNGYISFNNVNIASGTPGFPMMPSNDAKNDVLAAMLSDMKADGAGNPSKVYYYSDLVNQKFIVTYENYAFWKNTSTGWAGSNTFQIILDASDSTITYQYQAQTGSWDASYNTRPQPCVIGIENNTGQIGLTVSKNVLPTVNRAIRFKAPAVPLISINDAAPVALLNPANQAIIVPVGQAVNLQSTVGNTGNLPTTTPIDVVANVGKDNAAPTYTQNASVAAGVPSGGTQNVSFAQPFTPSAVGSYKYEVSTTITGDQNPANDVQTMEIVAADTTLTYAPNDVVSGLLSWTGGAQTSGAAQFYEAWAGPVVIKSITVGVGFAASTNAGTTAFSLAFFDGNDPNLLPGALLSQLDIPTAGIPFLPGANQYIPLNIPLQVPVLVPGTSFYVSWTQGDGDWALATQDTTPISRRTFEILDGTWATYRDNDSADLFIRLNIEPLNVGINQPATDISALSVYPNPTSGILNLDLSLTKSEAIAVKLYDLNGNKVMMQFEDAASEFHKEFNIEHLPSGVYMMVISTPTGDKIEKVVKQ